MAGTTSSFARQSAAGELLQVCGRENTFDFTHLDDVTLGLLSVVEAMQAGEVLPPIHLATGLATTLVELADIAVRLGGGKARVAEVPAPSYNVSRFVGDPARARELLGWRARIKIGEGMNGLIEAHRHDQGTAPTSNVA